MTSRVAIGLAVLSFAAAACTSAAEPSAGPAGDSAPSTTGSSNEAPTTPTSNPAPSYAGTDPAPEFPSGLTWLNTGRELSLAELRGKVVLLDFWTYGCINCIHIIPDLKRLEEQYDEELVVIGVHSAKFPNEGETDNIRQVILRYGIEHPVVNDRDFAVWNAWGAKAWPSVAVIDPAGNIVGGHSGEGVYDVVAPVIGGLIGEFHNRGELDRSPLAFDLESEGLPQTPLSFPGKVLADTESDRIFIADTGHNRVVVTDGDGDVLAVYGSGRPGDDDGAALEARFQAPQGLALSADGSTLYVADTNNHVIRSVDLESGRVATLAGSGRQGWPPSPGVDRDVDLNSPWGLTRSGDTLYIAMAGFHQIWSLDLITLAAEPVVGNGSESTANGPLADAELAQPSGLTFADDGLLYLADSESSSIRSAEVLDADGVTRTLAGSDMSLFDFGDQDGIGTAARFQHPLGIAFDEATGTLIVADTYNSRLRLVDPKTGTVTTFAGSEQGWADGADPKFYEPGGLSLRGSTLYVADTNNHAIRLVDTESKAASTLVLKGIDRFAPPPEAENYQGRLVHVEPTLVGAGAGSFVLDIELPNGYKVNDQAPSSVQWAVSAEAVAFDPGADRSLTGTTFPVEIPAEFSAGEATVTADVTIIYCPEDAESLCLIEQVRFDIPVVIDDRRTSARIVLPHRIELPDL